MRWFLFATAMLAVFAFTVSAADTQPSEQAKGTITGKVLHNGKPMPGMRVAVFDTQDVKRKKLKGAKEQAADGVKKIFGKGNPPKAVAQTVTAADGSFTLEVPAGHYFIMAGGKKIGAAHERVEVKSGESVKVDLSLQDRGVGGKNKIKGGEDSPATQPA
jgi:hypothetical protein